MYDRASLPALPGDMRRDYADLMLDCLAPGTVILLQTPEYRQTEMDGPPFSVPPAEVEALYGEVCTIERLHSEGSLDRHPRFRERGLTGLVDHVYRIEKKRNDD